LVSEADKAKLLSSPQPKHGSFDCILASPTWPDSIKTVGICRGGPFDGKLMCSLMAGKEIVADMVYLKPGETSDQESKVLGEYNIAGSVFLWTPFV